MGLHSELTLTLAVYFPDKSVSLTIDGHKNCEYLIVSLVSMRYRIAILSVHSMVGLTIVAFKIKILCENIRSQDSADAPAATNFSFEY